MSRIPDVIIIGGGIVGLWCARRARQAGLDAILLDRGGIAQGASGGLLGALMPHQPSNWNDVKQFQFDALVDLEDEVAALESETGQDCGYLRCGRLLPVRTEQRRTQATAMATAADEVWRRPLPDGRRPAWRLLTCAPTTEWLSSAVAPLGAELDTLSGRCSPRGLTAALRAAVTSTSQSGPPVEVRTFEAVSTIDATGAHPVVQLSNGERLEAGFVINAAGVSAFGLAAPHLPASEANHLGTGVKGQAAMLAPLRPVDPGWPIVYDGGLYLIAHSAHRVAVGSTSENTFDDGHATDGQLDALLAQAEQVCPALRGADVIERWAGVRPKAVGRQPVIGPLPETPRVILAGGGFKISFGVAHAMADAAIGFVTGREVRLPERLTISDHLKRARRAAEKAAAPSADGSLR